jgi:hypothetical protein
MKKKFTFLSTLILSAFFLNAQPLNTATPPPSRNASNVISIYSNAYTNIPNVNYNPFWNQSGFANASEITINGDDIRSYTNMNYQGIDFNSNRNVSSLDSVHFDIWSSNCSSIGITLVASGSGEREVTRALNLNTWNSIDIALSDYSSQGNFPLTAIFQFKFVAKLPAVAADVWVDNMYFYTNANLPTISNFSIAPVLRGAPSFTITPPTSNSLGAFTYSSSNTNVATINGDVITVLDAGTSTITASQAADGAFSAGTITADFVVTIAPLSINADNPTHLNVISLFSDAFATNVPVSSWRAVWSGAGPQTDTAINGNNIKKYESVDYVGIEFPAIDATLADSLHISMWTPSAQTFSIKLVNTGGGPLNENIVHFTSRPQDAGLITKYGTKPNQGEWNNYSIPMSLFATPNGGLQLTTRNSLYQMLFVGLNAPFSDNIYYVDNIYFSGSGILPVNFKSINVEKENNGAKVSWTVGNQSNLNSYIVEKSLNGREFSAIQNVKASTQQSYSFTDINLVNGNTYYRVKAVDNNGKYAYSQIVSIKNSKNENGLNMYPIPAKNQVIINNLNGNNNISIVNVIGQVVFQRLNVTGTMTNLDISTLQNGIYTVVVNNNGESKTLKLLVQK